MRKRLLNAILIIALLLCYYLVRLIINQSTYAGDYIVFLNVGTGDSILIKSRGEFMLIDGGPSSFSSNKVYKYTFTKKPIAYLSTHYHSDHISGLVKALQDTINYDVFSNIQDSKTYQGKTLKKIVEQNNYKTLHTGDSFIFGDFRFIVLAPRADCISDNFNACSVALMAIHSNGKKVLLLSDSEKESQENYLHLVDDVDYIKVPHQGSDDSLNKELLSIAKPEYAIISVGENNYGHPKQSVIDYYKKQGIKILRTDEEGDVLVYFE